MSSGIVEKWKPAPGSPMAELEAARSASEAKIAELTRLSGESGAEWAHALEIVRKAGAYTDISELAGAMMRLPALERIHEARHKAKAEEERALKEHTDRLKYMDSELNRLTERASSIGPEWRESTEKTLRETKRRILGA